VQVGGDPGPWGRTVAGGRGWRLWRRLVVVVSVVAVVGGVAAVTSAQLLLAQAETNLTRVPVPELERSEEPSDARSFLVVGSDARDGLEGEDREEMALGEFEGQRSDVILYVSISEDRETVSLVSLPRDLLVLDDGRQAKLTDTFAGGPDELVRVIRDNFGLPVNHYSAVSLGGFVEVVRTLGGVEICLDEPLDDWRAGADFDAGCHEMDATEALAYVRSRQGDRADFERIDRQQQFMRSVLTELTEARVLANPRRVSRLVEDVSTNVTTDDDLDLGQMLGLADELRGVVAEGLPMTTVPAYPRRIDGIEYMIAYEPGAEALFDALRDGEPVAERGSRDERDETRVAIVSGGRDGAAEIVRATLGFAGFDARGAGHGAAELDAGATTVVHPAPGEEERADWVAATLGADVEPLPDGTEVAGGASVLVRVGEDATGSGT
jgi:LCP family protein required for cell wall assembly